MNRKEKSLKPNIQLNHNLEDLNKKKIALFSLAVSIFLVTVKIGIAYLTNSIGVYSEALNNGLDLVTVLITYLAIRMSVKPADKDHTYGHGKYENFSALLEIIIISILSFFIIFKSVQRLIYRNFELNVSWYIFLILAISIIINIIRVIYIGRAAKKYNSFAFKANFINYAGDVSISIIVIIGLILANTGIYIADPIASIISSVIILAFSFKVSMKTIKNLLDYIPKEVTDKIVSILENISEIESIDSVKIHEVGNIKFINLGICLASNLYLSQVEKIKQKIKDKISENILNSEIIIEIKSSLSDKNISDFVKKIVLDLPNIKDIHNILIYRVGSSIDLSIHLEISSYLKLDKTESLTKIAEEKIKKIINNIRNIYIHIEDKKDIESWYDITQESERLISKIKKEISNYVNPDTCHNFTILKRKGLYNLAFHCRFRRDTDVKKAHVVATNIENKIKENFKNIKEISIHMEPK